MAVVERETEMSDLDFDVLRHILGFVARSGGKDLVKTMAVCRMFRELGNDGGILKSTVSWDVVLSDNLHLFQQFNGILIKAAQSGSLNAQFMLAKIVLKTSTQLMDNPDEIDENFFGDFFDEDQSYSDSNDTSDDEMFDSSSADIDTEDTPASVFLSQFGSVNHSETPSHNLHHYHFVRIFLSYCSPHDLSEMRIDFHCYYQYCIGTVSEMNSLFSKFISLAEKLSNFLKGIDELEKYRHGHIDLDNQEEEETLSPAPNHDDQNPDNGQNFIQQCRKIGKSLVKMRNERPEDKELMATIDAQFEEYEGYGTTLTTSFEKLRRHMLPILDSTFHKALDIVPPQSLKLACYSDI